MRMLASYVFGILFAAFLAMSAASYISGLMDRDAVTINRAIAP